MSVKRYVRPMDLHSFVPGDCDNDFLGPCTAVYEASDFDAKERECEAFKVEMLRISHKRDELTDEVAALKALLYWIRDISGDIELIGCIDAALKEPAS